MSKSTTCATPQDSSISDAIKFSDLSLLPEVQQAVASKGYSIPSPIQAQAIPYLLNGEDIIGVAQTGTGKTAAFALPLLSNMNVKAKKPQVLCLAPTRELAIQVAEAFEGYAENIRGVKVLSVYGGADYRSQIRGLERGSQVVVGTPGRVMDHIKKGTLKLDDLKTLVLDEADEMLRMGFIDDVEWILEQIPGEHQTALFSATMPPRIRSIANKYLKKPAEITIRGKTTTAPNIRQRFVSLRNHEKLDTMCQIIETEPFEAMIIFTRTKRATVDVAERLQSRGVAVEALNGDVAQSQREKIVQRLKNGNLDIIVATDVAARGLDVERISHVINYDAPGETETYVHRVGRTGRAGRSGDAILFVNGGERTMLKSIERATKQKIETFEFPTLDELNKRKFEKFFARIDTELEKDLSEYASVIEKFMARGNVDPSLLAAALASMEADGKPFYIKKFNKPTPAPARSDRSDRDGGRGRDRREGRGGRESRGGRDGGRRDTNRFERSDMNTDTFRLEVGKDHGVGKGDIVGAIANEVGIESKFMGKIVINGEHSFIDLPKDMPKDVFAALKKLRVRGEVLNASAASGGGQQEFSKKPRESRGRDSRSSESRSSKPRGFAGDKPRGPSRSKSRDFIEDKPRKAKKGKTYDSSDDKPRKAKKKSDVESFSEDKPRKAKESKTTDFVADKIRKAKGSKFDEAPKDKPRKAKGTRDSNKITRTKDADGVKIKMTKTEKKHAKKAEFPKKKVKKMRTSKLKNKGAPKSKK